MDIWTQLLAASPRSHADQPDVGLHRLRRFGTAIGVTAGPRAAVTVAMLLADTSQVEPTASMIFFAGIYYGAMYGGSTTSILLNTPGETRHHGQPSLEGFKDGQERSAPVQRWHLTPSAPSSPAPLPKCW